LVIRSVRAPIDRSIVIPFIIFTVIWGSTWIVIRDQLGVVPAQWSVAYRFILAAAGMALVARWQGHSLRPSKALIGPAAIIGISQFCGNFNSVYMAEHHITSGLVATVFALLLIPNSLLAWAFLGQRPSRRFFAAAAVATVGIGLLFVHELRAAPAAAGAIVVGIGWTLLGLFSA
jgi:drug/metabolite transporter (DMT)-like permease